MKQVLLKLGLLVAAAVTVAACGGAKASPTNKLFSVVVRATSDDGEPVANTKFATSNGGLGVTGADGETRVSLRGVEGQALKISATCPEGYAEAEAPVVLKLTEVRGVNQSTPAPLAVNVQCQRKMRDVVIVVRTANAPSLPVDVGGKSLGVTDEQGSAHLHLQVERETRSLSVSLATSQAPLLRPQNPSRVFELDGQDAILLLEQSFSSDRKRTLPRRPVGAMPQKHVPYRVN